MNKIARCVAFAATLALVQSTTVHYTPVNALPRIALGVPIARADAAGFGYRVLKCFHPSADFVRASFGARYRDRNGRDSQDGQIDFKGGLTGSNYSMTFVVHRKVEDRDNYIRVTPLDDSAPLRPSDSCYLREWTRVE